MTDWKLFCSSTSPYARKVRIVVEECGIADAVQEIAVSPMVRDKTFAQLLRVNPLAKIPSLVLSDGTTLYDSRVICEYLVSLPDTPSHLAFANTDASAIRRRAALSDGILDAAFNLVMELRRPEPQRSEEWQARWEANIRSAISILADETMPEAPFDLGSIGALCVVDYLDFRLPKLGLVPKGLVVWRSLHENRHSVLRTIPYDL